MTTALLTPHAIDNATRREFLTALAAAGLLTGCATPTPEQPAPSTRPVQHALGTTEVPLDPQRVVAVTGTVEVDTLVALGVIPVAAAELEQGVGFSRQVADTLTDTAMLATRREINLEAVAAQRPDLIVGTVGWLGDLYTQLSAIAPTVAIDDATGWRDVTRQVADAVGRPADDVITAVDAQIDALAQRSDGRYDGLTYTLMASFPTDGEYGLYRLTDDIDALLGQLGMQRTDTQLDLFTPEESYVAISTEQVQIIDTDSIFLFGYSDPESQADIATTLVDPLFATLPAAQAGRVFTVDSDHWYFATPQSIEQVLADLEQDILPRLTDPS